MSAAAGGCGLLPTASSSQDDVAPLPPGVNSSRQKLERVCMGVRAAGGRFYPWLRISIPNYEYSTSCKTVFPFETVEMALDFVKRRPAIKEELDLVLAEVRLRNIAPGSSAHSELLHHILNELQVPLFNATPVKILKLMNVKCLTSKQIASHLQKHRLHQRNAKKGGQSQKNASMKPVSELIGSAHNAATTESIAPGVDADIRAVYPLRLWKQVKEAAASNIGMYSRTSGNYKDGTKSVWDEYEKSLHKKFSASNRRWQQIGLSSSKHQFPVKNNVVAISVESSDSSSLSTNLVDQDGENTRTEAAGNDDNMGNINMFKDGGISSEAPKAAGEIGYGASGESFGLSSLPTRLVAQIGENNRTETAGNNDNVGNINMLEGTMNKEHTAATDPDDVWGLIHSNDLDLTLPYNGMEEYISNWMCELQGSQDQQNLDEYLEDLLQVDNAQKTGLASTSPIDIDGSMAQEASAHNAPVDNPMTPNAQDDGLWDGFDMLF
nr:unnamed protein product [Digitaria exilis]